MTDPSVALEPRTETLMIVAGEASGDLHGANLVRALKRHDQNLHFFGMGGPALADAGVTILFDAAHIAVVGLFEVLSHLKDIREARRLLIEKMRAERPALLILIDFPDFNLLLAKEAKKLGIPVFYYISPQVWAWRSGRVRKIRKVTDTMAVILPFEKDFYKQYGMDVHFVGHPLADELAKHVNKESHRDEFRKSFKINDPKKRVIGLLPGSRKKEVMALLPIFLETIRKIALNRKEDITVLLALAPTLQKEDLPLSSGALPSNLRLEIIQEHRYQMMSSCDLALAASGTVTLELALLTIPMVVAYKIAPLTYQIGKRLINVPFASLVNLVVDREVVQECLQENCTPEKLSEALEAIWPGNPKHEVMRKDLKKVSAQLGGPGASERTAQLVRSLLAARHQ